MNVDVVYGANQSTFFELYTLSKSFIHVLNAVNKKLKPNKGMSPHPQPVSTFEYIFFLHILLLSRIILLLYPPILSNFLHKLPKITQQNYKENNTKRALAVRIGILSYAFL